MTRMKHLVMLTLLSGGFALMSGCADTNPTDPFEEISLTAAFGKGSNGGGPGGGSDGGGNTSAPTKLKWLEPVTQGLTYSADCTPLAGCVIGGERGLIVAVPPGALNEAVQISVTILAGTTVDFEFAPHGTVFNEPIGVSVDQNATDGSGLKNKFYAIYWNGDPNTTEEVLDAYARKDRINFFPTHFSGYALAM